MAKIVTFGEIMLRLTPAENFGRFVQADKFNVIFGGGEANVAVSCAGYGDEAYFVSKLPTHEIGQAAVNCGLPACDRFCDARHTCTPAG